MNFSKTTEYALRILTHMALDTNKLYRANDLHEPLEIPLRYLRKLLTTLSKSGLLKSVLGKGGGYKIARELNNIYLIDIVKATAENRPKRDCFYGYEICNREQQCVMHYKWIDINDNIDNVLKSTSLAQLKDLHNSN